MRLFITTKKRFNRNNFKPSRNYNKIIEKIGGEK